MSLKVGIIGFGTVGTVLSDIFMNSGFQTGVYDVLFENSDHKQALLDKAEKHNVPILNLAGLLEEHTYIISTVTTQVAEQVAQNCLTDLKKSHVYIDCNSTSPGKKIAIQKIIQSAGANFVEGVILNAINPGEKDLHMLTGGDKGREVSDFFEKCNIKSKFYSEIVGQASMFKMLRSVFSKGLEVLLLEMLVSSKKAGIEADIWNEITTFMDSKSFADIGKTWITTHVSAYERRLHEMQQVLSTLDELEAPSAMTRGSIQWFEKSADISLNTYFSKPPSQIDEVITVLAEKIKS